MEKNKHKVFVRFLLSYVLILLIPLAIGGQTRYAIWEMTRDLRPYQLTESGLALGGGHGPGEIHEKSGAW